MANVFIDLGANVGTVTKKFIADNPGWEFYCVEPNILLIPRILGVASELRAPLHIIWAAAWTHDGTIDLFQSGKDEASTVIRGKMEHSGWLQIDYERPEAVPCFDFSIWLLRHFALTDNIVVKMDIEGAEYELLEKMIQDRSIHLVTKLICEWHFDRYPSVSRERHQALKRRVGEIVSLESWT
jgi:FkbM family methyltransferase